MIECIFTIDYEIYGDGTGSLNDSVYQPARRLKDIFDKWDAHFVNFVEVAEFDKIRTYNSDPDIGLIEKQIRELHAAGFEIGLHLHPQWCNARYERSRWVLDFSEYNLCTLSRNRITDIIEHSLAYLRKVLDQSDFTPLSFRAGNWLFQPTKTVASVLSDHGLKVDSSVFKGGAQRNYKLDYRPAAKNGYYWSFNDEVNQPDPTGAWIEVPIFTEMVTPWKMSTKKRISFGGNIGMVNRSIKWKLNRMCDFIRLQYPRKFDFCRMTLDELISIIDRVMREDRQSPAIYRPLVAIGHTKDFNDAATVDAFLSFLRSARVPITTFQDSYPRLLRATTEATSMLNKEATIPSSVATSRK